MKFHEFKINAPETGRGATVEMDGFDIQGMTRMGVDIDAGDVTRVSLEIVGPALLELTARLSLSTRVPELIHPKAKRLIEQAMNDVCYLVDPPNDRTEDDDLGAVGIRFMELMVEESESTSSTGIDALTDEQLLRELIRRNPVLQGPSKSVHAGTIREANIGIGNDNMATILLHQDDVEALEERNS